MNDLASTLNQKDFNKQDAWKMFDRISARYDFLNHLFSLGLDISWRRHLRGWLPSGNNLRILDLATGTADVLISLAKDSPNIKSAYGLDLSEQMLTIGRRKIEKSGLNQRVSLQNGDAHRIPFGADSFDCATMAFGIRNMSEPERVLGQMFKILKPSGRALILEFSVPQNPIIRPGYLFYLRHVIPFLGGIISRDWKAYRYLNKTVETFPSGEDFCRMMQSAGFKNTCSWPLTFGIATIYQGEK